jgi:hypothetical protein
MLPRVAIPTYKRASLISGLTLKVLYQANYPASLIYLFVASEEEAEEYRRLVPNHLYGQIVVGVPGLMAQRNYIIDYFDEDEIVLGMDDDVKGIKTKPTMGLIDLVLKGVKCLDRGGLWGIMPNDDGRKMEEKTTTHLTHIITCFYMFKNHKDLRVHTTEKEDFERSILYFKRYGTVSRYKGAGVLTSYEGTPGGLQVEGRRERMLEAIKYMAETYPEYVLGVTKRKGYDITLNWRAI